MRRVLFVDDEPNLLQALRFMLRSYRADWQMVFVDSGAAALRELAKGPFDVVVSDMCMPQMDGAELLAVVARRWPTTTRLLLSGYADETSLERARQVAHVCLDKPCAADELCAAIEACPVAQA